MMVRMSPSWLGRERISPAPVKLCVGCCLILSKPLRRFAGRVVAAPARKYGAPPNWYTAIVRRKRIDNVNESGIPIGVG
jgi:hypothetical protein